MRKKIGVVCLVIAAMALTGCGKGSNDKKDDKKVSTSSDAEAGTFVLGEYKGLEGILIKYEVTDEDMENEISTLLYDYTEYTDVDRAAKEGDYVRLLFKAEADGEVLADFSNAEEEGYEFFIGMADYGEEFDQKLVGLKKGDAVDFELTYDEDSEISEFAGHTVKFTGTCDNVSEESVPELTDAFIKDSLGYESRADMEAKIKEELVSSNESYNKTTTKDDLLQQVIDGSTFGEIPAADLEAAKQEVAATYQSYAEMFGCETVEQVYDMFGMSEDDVVEEAKSSIYRKMVINEISKLENLKVTDDVYKKLLSQYATENGYDSAEEFEADVDKNELMDTFQEELVLDFLFDNAKIVEMTQDEYNEKFGEGEDFEGFDEEELHTGTDGEISGSWGDEE